MRVEEVGGAEDEHLAYQVGLLLFSAHEADHAPSSRSFNYVGERARMTSCEPVGCRMTAAPSPPSERVSSTREMPPRRTNATRSSS
jgi:hypothetical protein